MGKVIGLLLLASSFEGGIAFDRWQRPVTHIEFPSAVQPNAHGPLRPAPQYICEQFWPLHPEACQWEIRR